MIFARWLQTARWAAEGRSSHWETIRKQHIELFPTCAVCGGDENLQVHHIRPFHLHPELELDMDNLITLCEPSVVIGCNCHLVFGHAGNWKLFVPNVKQNAELLLPQFQKARKPLN